MTDLVPFQDIAQGGTFFLDAYEGNSYRKTSEKTAEFTRHSLGNRYVGCEIHIGPMKAVRKRPLSSDEIDILGIDTQDEPFRKRWVPNPDFDLLGDFPASERKPAPKDEDLLGDFPPPAHTAAKKISKRALRRAAKQAELDLL